MKKEEHREDFKDLLQVMGGQFEQTNIAGLPDSGKVPFEVSNNK